MSITARQELVAKLLFIDGEAKADLLDPEKTNTWVIAALEDFRNRYAGDITITSVRSDHSNDGCSPHSHASGDAWDMAVDDWGQALRALCFMAKQNPTFIYEVGKGGIAQQHDPGGWPGDFDIFDDNDQDHIHVSAALQ